jgi:RNA polymerase sigma factor (sigma-70 family)
MQPPHVKQARPATRFDEMFSRHYDALIAWCRKHTWRALGEPEDFVHAAYLRCRAHWSEAQHPAGRERAYLYRALRWVLIDALRKRRHQPRGGEAAELTAAEFGSSPLRQLVVKEAVARLSGHPGQVFRRLLAGQDEATIRQEMQLSLGALAVCRSRAKRALSNYLEMEPSCKARPVMAKRAKSRGPSVGGVAILGVVAYIGVDP